MNISGMINNLKGKVREKQTMNAERTAHKLKELREERIRLEGQSKIYDLQAQEKTKIKQAKKQIMKKRFGNSGFGKVATNVIKKVKEYENKKPKKKKSFSFAPDGKDHPMFRK